jgi:hypothetical protein
MENYRIRESPIIQSLSNKQWKRVDKWNQYFLNDPDGKLLHKCIKSRIKSREWETEKGAAEQIDAIFKVSSFVAHATPVSIHENQQIPISSLCSTTHQVVFMSCVASTFNLSLID